MNIRTNHPLLLLLLCSGLLISFAGCFGTKAAITAPAEDNGEIPPEFHNFKSTLLVIKHPRDFGYDKSLKKELEKNYTGTFIQISSGELANYPAEQYRYIFTNLTVMINGGTSSGSYYIPQLKDRLTNKEYNTKNRIKLTATYLKALSGELTK